MCHIIAICGASAVGKTSVAKPMAERLHCEVRHCGDAAKAEASELGVPPDALPKEAHRRIDNETRRVAQNAQDMLIIEGRFLDEVLAGVPGVLLVHLTVSEEVRKHRQAARGSAECADSLLRRDGIGGALCSESYAQKEDQVVSLCTDALDVNEVVESILMHWRSLVAGPAAQNWERRYQTQDTPWTTGYPSTELALALNENNIFAGAALEVGCGIGTNSIYMASRGLSVTGIDISPFAVDAARERSSILGIGCEFETTDIFRYAAGREGEFGFIFDRGFFHCLPRLLAREWAGLASSVLCEGGLMLVLTGNERETSEQGPPKLSSDYLLSMFLPRLSVVSLREFKWDAVAGSDWRALGWSLLLRRRRCDTAAAAASKQ